MRAYLLEFTGPVPALLKSLLEVRVLLHQDGQSLELNARILVLTGRSN